MCSLDNVVCVLSHANVHTALYIIFASSAEVFIEVRLDNPFHTNLRIVLWRDTHFVSLL